MEEGEKNPIWAQLCTASLYIILDFALSEHCSSDYQFTPTSGININSYQCEELITDIKKTELTLLEVGYTQESINSVGLLSHCMKRRFDSGL